MRLKHSAFTMIELVFVIVVLGIIGKFGVEFLAQAYNNFIHSTINNSLQGKSEYAVEFIASRLQDRIKDSVIGRASDVNASFKALSSISAAEGDNYTVLEWIGADIEGFRGNSAVTPIKPDWSGIIDVDNILSSNAFLVSPETNTSQIDTTIKALSNDTSNINNAALYFIGSNSNIVTGYGWDGNLTDINDQNGTMHPINSNANIDQFVPAVGTFHDIYEYYKLAWSAYAVVMRDYNTTTKQGDLWFYYNYQPWLGEDLNDATSVLLLEDVGTFRFRGVGSIIKVEVCAKSTLLEDYSLCKEKTVF